ncbi:hypothetical protein HNQ09_003300 [Deinococcus budaensis]|uniref:Uncharacterized protein n=1 Tax=Deinococcus budaensis TaxID=1665626 RepID=A0A7W8LRF4_9DEIO|nr:hypothetical protein [Deinococcus budaensis]
MKKFFLMPLFLSGLSLAQTLPTPSESVTRYVDSLNTYTETVNLWQALNISQCTLARARIIVTMSAQVEYNKRLTAYFTSTPATSISTSQLNDYRTHVNLLNALVSLNKATELKCNGNTGDTPNLYFQIAVLHVSIADLFYSK